MALQVTSPTFLAIPSTSPVINPTVTVTFAQTQYNAAPVWRATSTRSTEIVDASCTPFSLPSYGRLSISPTETLTLSFDAMFTPLCIIDGNETYLNASDNADIVSDEVADSRFYSSTVPMTYAVAVTTVVAYFLFLLLLVSAPGSRPWLQKVATFSVVVSLTIAWSEMNHLIEQQYDHGYFSAQQIRDQVVGGEVIRVSRVISDTFLYLAQIQTLIRLFPRHREKIVIKWVGFALIVLDTVFSIINNFVSPYHPDKGFLDAVPTLSYLLQIAISFLYVSCVMYYAFSHRRFAFLPPLSIRNQHRHASASSQVAMPLIALLSMSAILIPIVFFVLDISNPNLAGWGDFVRWVGAAAASVVVWEWVDRIEGLEELGRKRGILGRQVFDGDEMLEGVGGTIVNWDDKGPGAASTNSGSQDSSQGLHGRGGNLESQPEREAAITTRVLNVMQSDRSDGRQTNTRAGHFFPSLSRATSGSTSYRIRAHSRVTPPPLAHVPTHSASNSGDVRSRAASALANTISDLAISPTGTPSLDADMHRVIPAQRITFDEEGGSEHRHAPVEGDLEMTNLTHVHRAGQVPFRPEDFGFTSDIAPEEDKGVRRFNIFRRRKVESEEDGRPTSKTRLTNTVLSQTDPPPPEPSPSPGIIVTQAINTTLTTKAPTDSTSSTSSPDPNTKPSLSFMQKLKNDLLGSRNKTAVPLPITIIPPLRRGEVVDLRDVEQARNIERARQFPGSAQDQPMQMFGEDDIETGDSQVAVARYVTRFGGSPDLDYYSGGRSSRTDSDRLSVHQTNRASPGEGSSRQNQFVPALPPTSHPSTASVSPTTITFRPHNTTFNPVAVTITPPPPGSSPSSVLRQIAATSSTIGYHGSPSPVLSTNLRASPLHTQPMAPPYSHPYHHQQSSLTTERDIIAEEDFGEEAYDKDYGERQSDERVDSQHSPDQAGPSVAPSEPGGIRPGEMLDKGKGRAQD